MLGGDESLFCWLKQNTEICELNVQYRMNSSISNLANKYTYNGKLICGDLNNHNTIASCSELATYSWEDRIFSANIKDAALFLDTGDSYVKNMDLIKSNVFAKHISKMSKLGYKVESPEKVYVNLVEAVIVLHLVTKFFKCQLTAKNIGVIATYRSQVDCIKSMAKTVPEFYDLEINTVDQYQGRDKEVRYSLNFNFLNHWQILCFFFINVIFIFKKKIYRFHFHEKT